MDLLQAHRLCVDVQNRVNKRYEQLSHMKRTFSVPKPGHRKGTPLGPSHSVVDMACVVISQALGPLRLAPMEV
jgi:hypothetical protein